MNVARGECRIRLTLERGWLPRTRCTLTLHVRILADGGGGGGAPVIIGAADLAIEWRPWEVARLGSRECRACSVAEGDTWYGVLGCWICDGIPAASAGAPPGGVTRHARTPCPSGCGRSRCPICCAGGGRRGNVPRRARREREVRERMREGLAGGPAQCDG
jgi:hypothetical protein